MAVTSIPIPLASLKALSREASDERLINAYAEATSNAQDAKAVVYGAAGSTTFNSTPSSPCRGLFEVDGTLYGLFGPDLYSFSSTAVATLIGNIAGTHYAIFARNANVSTMVAIVTEGNAYLLQAGAVAIWPDADLPQGDIQSVEWMDGYFVFAIGDGRFFWSGINDSTIDPLDFATAEANADGLVCIKRLRQELYMFGTQTIEVWADTGDAALPFQRLPGAVVAAGCASKATVQDLDSTLYFLDVDNLVRRIAAGYQAEIVSCRGVYDAVKAVTDKTEIEAFTYVLGDHLYYVLRHLTFTWVYDAKNGIWHERTSKGLAYWKARCCAFAFGKIIIGSSVSGAISYIDETSYTENGDEIESVMRFPRIETMPDGGTFDCLDLEFEMGVGIATSSESDTVTPHFTLRWSDDGSKTWKGGRIYSLGAQGEYTKTARCTRLGSCGPHGRIFQVEISSKVFKALLNAHVSGEDLVLSS
jgi:hypothetical protein